jgi:hypothetical protein
MTIRLAESANTRRALLDLEDDLERARANLSKAVSRIVPGADIDDIIIREDGEPATVNVGELQTLISDLDDAPYEIEGAFEDFDWEVRQALKTFKQQLAREEAP